ncbi:MAG TPA: methyltransferase domain-containing protein [Polyangiaceae bacterium]|nr:methyltransferase domain-containing protein [Polyangiaceae bacterium]
MSRPPSPFALPEPWELVADGYAAEAHWVMSAFSERAIELAALPPTAMVLDVAAGPGTLALAIAPHVESVHALDFSAAMLAQLQRTAAVRGLTNVHVHEGDGQALSFADRSFDAAFSMFGLMFFPDRLQGFGELLRVLRPGGIAVVSSWAPADDSPLLSLMFGALRAADPERAPPARDLLSLENPVLFAEEMRSAGFEDVQVSPHVHSVRIEDAGAAWDTMVRSSAPLVMLRRRLGEEVWAQQAERAKAYIAEQLGTGAQELSTTAFLGTGRKAR